MKSGSRVARELGRTRVLADRDRTGRYRGESLLSEKGKCIMKFASIVSFPGSAKTLIFVLATALGACSGETGESVPNDVEAAPPAQEAASDDALEGDLSDKAGDSYVQWCNEAGARGTICRQQGCVGTACYEREDEAIAECRSEVSSICGGAVQPWYIVMKADGYYWRLY